MGGELSPSAYPQVLGYAIIAVPVGILGAEVSARESPRATTSKMKHIVPEVQFCQFCGQQLPTGP